MPLREASASAFSPPHPERRPEPERWAAIRPRWPVAASWILRRTHSVLSVAGLVATPDGPALVSTASSSPWRNEPAPRRRSARTVAGALAENLIVKAPSCSNLRPADPETLMAVAGDFNQDRDGVGWHGKYANQFVVTGNVLTRAASLRLTDLDAGPAWACSRRTHRSTHLARPVSCGWPRPSTSGSVRRSRGRGSQTIPRLVLDLQWSCYASGLIVRPSASRANCCGRSSTTVPMIRRARRGAQEASTTSRYRAVMTSRRPYGCPGTWPSAEAVAGVKGTSGNQPIVDSWPRRSTGCAEKDFTQRAGASSSVTRSSSTRLAK